jgi:hypothetical protein
MLQPLGGYISKGVFQGYLFRLLGYLALGHRIDAGG